MSRCVFVAAIVARSKSVVLRAKALTTKTLRDMFISEHGRLRNVSYNLCRSEIVRPVARLPSLLKAISPCLVNVCELEQFLEVSVMVPVSGILVFFL